MPSLPGLRLAHSRQAVLVRAEGLRLPANLVQGLRKRLQFLRFEHELLGVRY
jgi:hypothetical protein